MILQLRLALHVHTFLQCSHFVQITTVPGSEKKGVTLSQHQKFRKSQIVCQELASIASEVGMDQFKLRFSLLKTLKDAWAQGKEVLLQVHEGLHLHIHAIY